MTEFNAAVNSNSQITQFDSSTIQNHKLAEPKKELEIFQTAINTLKTESESIRNKISDTQKKITTLDNTPSTTYNILNLRELKNRAGESLHKLETQLSEEEAKLKNLQNTKKVYTDVSAGTASKYGATIAKLVSNIKQIFYSSKINLINKQIDEACTSKISLEQAKFKELNNFKAIDTTIKDISSKQIRNAPLIPRLRAEISNYQSEIQDLEKNIKQIENISIELNDEKNSLKNEQEILKKHHLLKSSLENTMKRLNSTENEAEMTILGQQITELEGEIDKSSEKIKASETKIHELNNQIQALIPEKLLESYQKELTSNFQAHTPTINDLAKTALKEPALIEKKEIGAPTKPETEEPKEMGMPEKYTSLSAMMVAKNMKKPPPAMSLLEICFMADPKGDKPLTKKLLALPNEIFFQDKLPPLLNMFKTMDANSTNYQEDVLLQKLINEFPENVSLTDGQSKLPPLLNHLCNLKQYDPALSKLLSDQLNNVSLNVSESKIPPKARMICDLQVEGKHGAVLGKLMDVVTFGQITGWEKAADGRFKMTLAQDVAVSTTQMGVTGTLLIKKEMFIDFDKKSRSLTFDETGPSVQALKTTPLSLTRVTVDDAEELRFESKLNKPWGLGWAIDAAIKGFGLNESDFTTVKKPLQVLQDALKEYCKRE